MQMDVAVLILNRRALRAATGVVDSFEPVPMHAENADAQAVASAINEPVGTIDRHGSPSGMCGRLCAPGIKIGNCNWRDGAMEEFGTQVSRRQCPCARAR